MKRNKFFLLLNDFNIRKLDRCFNSCQASVLVDLLEKLYYFLIGLIKLDFGIVNGLKNIFLNFTAKDATVATLFVCIAGANPGGSFDIRSQTRL